MHSRLQTSLPKGVRRVPAVYLTHAFLAILAFAALREMNNLRVCNGLDGSIPTAPTRFRNGISKNHIDNFAGHPSEWETPRLSPIFLFCYYLRTLRSLKMTSTVDAKGVFWLAAHHVAVEVLACGPVTLYQRHHLNAGAGGNVIDGLLELVAIALNVLEVVAQGASNHVFNQNGFR